MYKILIVEDEAFLRRKLKELLVNQNFVVLTAASKTEALQFMNYDAEIDLVLLDIWLPDGDGFEVCDQIRKRKTTPIIFLTACDDEESVIKGLNIGGDDYISKPFRSGELISRIHANLRRRVMIQQDEILCSEELELNLSQARAYKNEIDLNLSPIEIQLLICFMQHAGMIVKRELLLERLWDISGKFVQDNTLSVSVSRLRNKIGQDYIETVHGFGYRFMKEVYSGRWEH